MNITIAEEILRRKRAIYDAFHMYLSDDQITQVFIIWEENFKDCKAFNVMSFFKEVRESLSLDSDLAKILHDRLIQNVYAKLDDLLPMPDENDQLQTLAEPNDISPYDAVKNIISKQIGSEDTNNLLARQLSRLGIQSNNFTKKHLEQSMPSLKGAIHLYCEDSQKAKYVIQQLTRLV